VNGGEGVRFFDPFSPSEGEKVRMRGLRQNGNCLTTTLNHTRG
jgi:hypothetical protein